jgi:hypothetical protein
MSRKPLLPAVALAGLAFGPLAAAEPDLKELLRAQLETARQGLEAEQKNLKAGKSTFDQTLLWSRRVLQAQLALSDKREDRVAAYETYLKQLREYEEVTRANYERGAVALLGLLEARYLRQEAEVQLAQAKVK